MEAPKRVAVIGAGPAGLAAIDALSDFAITIFESGAQLEFRGDRIESILAGVGGAGLYSDGKFSYYPSATRLWSLRPNGALRESYEWFRSMAAPFGLDAPHFPESLIDPAVWHEDHASRKFYRSDYLPLEDRFTMIRYLSRARDHVSYSMHRVCKISWPDGIGERVIIELESGAQERFDAVILASGRFGPLLLQAQFPDSRLRYKRAEIGFRIEQDSSDFIFAVDSQVDSKIILADGALGVEWRTFCCCRNGMVTPAQIDGRTFYSGRSDCPPTGRSNIGFLMRILDDSDGLRIWNEWNERLLAEGVGPMSMSLAEFLANPLGGAIERLYGAESSDLLAKGVRRLLASLGIRQVPDAEIYGPVVEGVGRYPELDESLRVKGAAIWGAGDVTGEFRGIVAALVSGHFVGTRVNQFLAGGGANAAGRF